jgi:hypothetical protein
MAESLGIRMAEHEKINGILLVVCLMLIIAPQAMEYSRLRLS